MFRKSMLLLTVIGCLVIWGCFRPKETNNTIIVKPGLPLLVLGDKDGKPTIKVKAQELKSGKIVEEQEIQGWITMPEEHWKAVSDRVKELEDALSAAKQR